MSDLDDCQRCIDETMVGDLVDSGSRECGRGSVPRLLRWCLLGWYYQDWDVGPELWALPQNPPQMASTVLGR
ncbi:uncharacterized protein A4U43_C07F6180 [Asparagus officinalis]|uniref:Uncharacterized protein n=1 Tax=Asparagus officinalis TaxID=4686 RepID=A0A5P1ED47_ASPOF|nr:uncharacterized protein A4U43_C07F6180 [Asparagus officinalis]